MTQRVDVHSSDGGSWLNQLPTNEAVHKKAFGKAAAGHTVTITPAGGPPPPPPTPSGYGEAGVFAGRGIMLGSNEDVWDQALGMATRHEVDVVAVTPTTPDLWIDRFTHVGCRVVGWWPPEITDVEFAEHMPGYIEQAENIGEWNVGHLVVRNLVNADGGIALNSWTYGRLDGIVAFPEAYFNDGWGVDFNVYRNYMAQGARGVVPLCGGWSSTGRSDAESARLYAALGAQEDFPGFWMFAGESLLTPQSAAVLAAWKPK